MMGLIRLDRTKINGRRGRGKESYSDELEAIEGVKRREDGDVIAAQSVRVGVYE